MVLGVVGIMSYGWVQLLKGVQERQELKRERAWIRISMMPFLQAESDRNTVRILNAAKSRGYESPFITELGQKKVLPQYLPLAEEGVQMY